MFRRLTLSVVALALGSTIASAQVKLENKFAEESKSTVHRDTTTKQTLTLAGMDIDTKSSTFIVATSSTGKRAADGTLKIEEKIDTMQSEITIPGGLIQFDSANPDKKADNALLEPILDIFRSVYRNAVTVEVDAKNKITSVKLPDGEYEKLPDAAKDQLSPETLKKNIENVLQFLPDEPVKKGDTWERSSEQNLGSGQTMNFRTKYEYQGTIEKDGKTLDKITGKAFEVSFAINGNAMLQVTKSDLKILESESTFLFDRERGSVVSTSSRVQIAGPLTLVINAMEFPGKVDLTIEEKSSREKK
jgi:Family of unknown function (DUF6263)